MIDLHSHILPGVDDGARSWEESLAMCRAAFEDGIRVMFATPHYQRGGGFEVDRETVEAGVHELNRKLCGEGIALEVRAGNEVLAHPEADALLARGDAASYGGGGRYMLLELPHQGLPLDQAQELVFRICLRGYVPVLAHPERNFLIRKNPQTLHLLVRQGALAQVTAMSLAGNRDPLAKKLCLGWAAEGMVHFVATDAHNLQERRPELRAAHEALHAALPAGAARSICEDNPRALLENRPIQLNLDDGPSLSLEEDAPQEPLPEAKTVSGLASRLLGRRNP